jgi:hypothetical protein
MDGSLAPHTTPPSRGARRPSCARNLPLLISEGAGNAGRRCARSRAWCVVNTRVSHHGHTGLNRHSPRNGFNGFLRALPGDRALLPPSSAVVRQLDTSVGAPGPHDFAVREKRPRQQRRPRPPHPAPHVRDDRDTPLLSRRDDGINKAASTKWGSEIFLRKGLDTKRADLPVGQNQRPLIVIRVSTMNDCSSWPGLTRPSTPCLEQIKKDVDARDKRGHDGASRLLRLNPGSSRSPPPRAWRRGSR